MAPVLLTNASHNMHDIAEKALGPALAGMEIKDGAEAIRSHELDEQQLV